MGQRTDLLFLHVINTTADAEAQAALAALNVKFLQVDCKVRTPVFRIYIYAPSLLFFRPCITRSNTYTPKRNA